MLIRILLLMLFLSISYIVDKFAFPRKTYIELFDDIPGRIATFIMSMIITVILSMIIYGIYLFITIGV